MYAMHVSPVQNMGLSDEGRGQVLVFANYCQHLVGDCYLAHQNTNDIITRLTCMIIRASDIRAAVAMTGLAMRFVTEAATRGHLATDAASQLLIRAVAIGLNEQRDAVGLPTYPLNTATHAKVQMALAFIDAKYSDESLRLCTVARHVSLSPSHLDRLLQRDTNHSFRYHLSSIRLAQARKLMTNTSLTIKEIAAATGFTHVGTLDRSFRRLYGITPTQLRRSR